MSAIDPTDIHPKHDRPTPENIDDWSDEQVERYNELKSSELKQEAQQTTVDESTLEAVEALKDPERPNTVTKKVNGAEIRIKTHLDEETEAKIEAITDSHQSDAGLTKHKTDLIDVLTFLCSEDENYSDRIVWETYVSKYGVSGTLPIFLAVIEPVLDRMEEHETVKNWQDRDLA